MTGLRTKQQDAVALAADRPTHVSLCDVFVTAPALVITCHLLLSHSLTTRAGMVLTDLLLQGSSPVARRFFNVLAEEPDTVAQYLVPRIRAVQVRQTHSRLGGGWCDA